MCEKLSYGTAFLRNSVIHYYLFSIHYSLDFDLS